MIEPGMRVYSRDGHRLGSVEQLIDQNPLLPPGMVLVMPRLFGLRHRRVALTTYDVRDVLGDNVILRITRWDARNRPTHALPEHGTPHHRSLEVAM